MTLAFQLARAEERRNRLMAYLPAAPGLCGLPATPLTARMVLELELVGNACICGGQATKDDVFDFLWRINPDFAPLLPERIHLLKPAATRSRMIRVWRRATHSFRVRLAFRSARTAGAYLRAERQVAAKSFSVLPALAEIRARRAQTYQDQAGDTGTEHGLKSPLAPDRHWVESFLDFYSCECGWPVDDVLDAPLARLFQIYREHCLARGIEAPFINASDGLVGPPPS